MSTHKRKYTEYISNNKLYSNQIISASQIHNYFMDDPLLDFLNKHGDRLGLYKDSDESNYNFSKLIMNLGNVWEDKIVNHIRCLVGENNTAIVKDKNFQSFKTSKDLVDAYLSNKVPVIFQAYLKRNLYEDCFHAYVDILCRVDYIEKIFENSTELQNLINDYKSKNIEYVAIDVKTSNFSYDNKDGPNGSKLDNSYFEYMQGQLHIYCKMNDENSKYGILIGRQLIQSGKKIKPFVVNINSLVIIEKIKACSRWLRRVEKEGKDWVILPKPSVRELYPNMKNSHDSEWKSVKNFLAQELKEITNLYYCSYNKRRYCHNMDILGYDNKNFDEAIQSTFRSSPVIKSVNGTNTVINKKAINNIINIAKVQREEIEESEILAIPSQDKCKYIYIDIETVYNFYNCIYDEYTVTDSSLNNKLDFISQIGIGYVNNNNKWVYRSFEMNIISFDEEQKIIKDCREYLQVILDICESICFVYFTKAENKVLSSLIKELVPNVHPHINFLDLHEEWLNRGYFLKNLLNFRLKEIIKALNERGKTTLSYDSLTIKDGSNAMAFYMIEDKIAKDNKHKIRESSLQILKEYNSTDCKALYELHKNLFKI